MCREDNIVVQIEARREGGHHSHHRLQRGVQPILQCELLGVGCGRPRQDPASMSAATIELQDIKMLLFVNKKDLPQAVDMLEVTEMLGLVTL